MAFVLLHEGKTRKKASSAKYQRCLVYSSYTIKKLTKHCNDALKNAQAALEAVDLSNKEAKKKRADVVLFEITGRGAGGTASIHTVAVASGGGSTWVGPHIRGTGDECRKQRFLVS